ncbi:MAG: YjgN family protein [Turicibacter sp.]|nr:YjgN family protein [Turicibacter sp.]
MIGWQILGALVIGFTAGIATPWAICMVYGWKINHTVVEGKRLKFTGSAVGLFGNWIKWFLLTLITLGIYGFWLNIALEKWKAEHTVFVD